MGQYTSYYLYQRYESRDGQRAIPSIPSYYSIDGDGTMERVIKMENDPNCGYVPPPTEPTYRWYQLPISQDYVCDSCGYVPPIENAKFMVTYIGGESYTATCNSSSTLIYTEIEIGGPSYDITSLYQESYIRHSV